MLKKHWRRLREDFDMAKDFMTDHDEKLLAFYSEMNAHCQKKLEALRRNWLDVPGTLTYYRGDSLPISEIGNVYPIKSILYSDRIAHSQVVYELMKAMRSWILTNASSKQSVVFIVSGTADKISLLANTTSSSNGKVSLQAAFPGVVFGDQLPLAPYLGNMRRGGIVTGIPAFSENEHEQLYSLDVLLRGLRGKNFSVVILGMPCEEKEIDQYLSETRKAIGENHEHIKQNISRQFGEGVARTIGTSFTSFGALMSSLTNTYSEARTTAHTIGGNVGVHRGVNAGMVQAGRSLGGSYAYTTAKTIANSIANTTGNAVGSAIGVNYSVTKMQNQSHANTLERLNQFAEAYEASLEDLETRYKNALAEGAWKSLTYVLAENDEDFKFASSLFKSCLTAHFDVYEPFRIVPLGNSSTDWESTIYNLPEVGYDADRKSLETILTSSEFAALISLPSESQPGIEVRETPRFSVTAEPPAGEKIELGHICDREVVTNNVMAITPSDLAAHTLVAGLTGMGKSTTIRHILSEVNVPFLVIEPAKSEYRNMCIRSDHIRVYTAGDEAVSPLRINPFELPPNDSLHSHIDSLNAILNAAFPMEGPMAALLEQGLVRAYLDAGWDVVVGKAPSDNKIPTMDDFYNALKKTIDEQHFQGDYGGNIKSALLARINSLRIGPRGRLFNSETPFDVSDLLKHSTVIEMKKVGSDETKAFLAGLLLLRVYKYFEQLGHSDRLRNVLVIEEAHRLFKKASDKGNSLVGNNSAHQSVQLFENILAEVRAYGLGIIIADQLPLRLSDGAVKNTNLKIIHRLGALEDAVAMGGSMGLDEKRSAFICRMKRGEALIHCSAVSEPVHVAVTFRRGEVGENLSDDCLKRQCPRTKATERRPPYFDMVKNQIEICKPREIEKIAKSCLFSILMVPWVKKDKWNYIWNSCVTGIIPNLGKQIKVPVSTDMAAHLLHSAILSLLKSKQFIAQKAPEVMSTILCSWDTVLSADGALNLEKVRDVRDAMLSEQLTKHANMPSWLPSKYPSAEKLYLEARQMAASLKLRDEKLIEQLRENKEAAVCKHVSEEVLGRTIQDVDVRGDTLTEFIFAVMIALLNCARPIGCTTKEYLARINQLIGECIQGGGLK